MYCGCEVFIRDLHWIRSYPAAQNNIVRFWEPEEALRELLELLLDLLRLYPSVRVYCLY